jgi:hypothetical protein
MHVVHGVANEINDTFLSPLTEFTTLPPDYYRDLFSAVTNEESTITVTTGDVFEKLFMLNPKKAHCPDGIPIWVLKENADLFAFPIKEILNSSFRECRVPQPWKNADIIPITKNKPITDINDHLRPISLTPILSKVAEEFVVERHLKPAILAKIDENQFGTIPNSSTTYALISMLPPWNRSTDANGSTNRIILFDFRKTIDLIDHSILLKNLGKYDIPKTTLHWILDFITDRR